MSRRFLIDANLPIALARRLTQLGHPSFHLEDIGQSDGKDLAIWQLAEQRGETIVSKGIDFADLVRASQSGPAVVWIRLGNIRTGPLLARIEDDLPAISALLESGERLIEVR